MAKTKKSKASTWIDVKPPKSSMEKDYVFTPDYFKGPAEESFWNPGEPKDSRKHQHDAYHPIEADEKNRYVMGKGKKKSSADEDMDEKYNKGEDYD